jgi:hypothetical protein
MGRRGVGVDDEIGLSEAARRGEVSGWVSKE